MTYNNDMTGIISKNERKADDKHPDIKGQCEIDGVQFWVDGWAKTRNSDGGKFYSLRFKRKDAVQPAAKPKADDDFDGAHQQSKAPPRQAAPQPARGGFDDMDSDIPFVTASAFYDMTTSKARKMARYDF